VPSFELNFDARARRFIDEHPSHDALVLAYTDTRC
jgi:hypothetical protein